MKPKKCKNCDSMKIVKCGFHNGIQRFRCKFCFKSFALKNSKSHPKKLILDAISLHNEGMPLRAIARRLKIGKSSVQRWILKYGKGVRLKKPKACKTIEIDEMQFFEGNKAVRKWLWVAVCRDSKKILAITTGGRGKKDFLPMWLELKKIKCLTFCTDRYDVYKSMLQNVKHKRGKKHTYTIEGMMSVIRHFLARFRRRTRCYSRNTVMAEAAVLLFADHWNKRVM